MDPYVFDIGQNRFVSGLFWQPLNSKTFGECDREIKSLAHELSFDLFVQRTTSTHFVGFAAASDQIKAGFLSAAAVVSKTLELEEDLRDFLFVSRLPSGAWMYVAQRDGVILPDGDCFFSTEKEAKARLFEDQSLASWNRIYAPAQWGIIGSFDRSFEELLPKNQSGKLAYHKWWRLQPVHPYMSIVRYWKPALAIILIGGALVGGWVYYKHIEQLRLIREAQELLEKQLQGQAAKPPPEKPWKKTPAPFPIMQACVSKMAEVNLYPGNWRASSLVCDNKKLRITWQAIDYGWIAHLRAVEPKAIVSRDGKSATLDYDLTYDQQLAEEPLPPGDARLMDLMTTAQTYGFNLTLRPVPPPKPVPGQNPKKIPPPQWQEFSWGIDKISLPLVAAGVLQGPGLRMTKASAKWEDGQWSWHLEGSQYVLP